MEFFVKWRILFFHSLKNLKSEISIVINLQLSFIRRVIRRAIRGVFIRRGVILVKFFFVSFKKKLSSVLITFSTFDVDSIGPTITTGGRIRQHDENDEENEDKDKLGQIK